MPTLHSFLLPDVGEGLTEASVVAWRVAEGAVVDLNDVVVEIETAKSLVELPSPFSGTVLQLHAAEGETIPVGHPLFTIRSTVDDGAVGRAAGTGDETAAPESTSVLVGYGPQDAARRRRRIGSRGDSTGADSAPSTSTTAPRPLAAPPVRALAKRMGIDLATLETGVVIRREDVLAARVSAAVAHGDARERRIPIIGVRKATAHAVTRSAFTAPHATEWLTADVTETMELLRELRADRVWTGVRLSPLVLMARALLLTVKRHPEINAAWDEEHGQIVVKEYVHLGIAAATPRGLLVPNIKHADQMDVRELALALDDLVQHARAGSTAPAGMTGGTITMTNIGVFGVDGGTPILNPGEAAILAVGAVRRRPWVVGDSIEIRETATLSISFDHRMVDGELASNVLAGMSEILERPARSLLYG